MSGTGEIQGTLEFLGCVRLDNTLWNFFRDLHQVEGPPSYGKNTFGWFFGNPQPRANPVPYWVKKGSVVRRKVN